MKAKKSEKSKDTGGSSRLRIPDSRWTSLFHMGVPKSVKTVPHLSLDKVCRIEALSKTKRPHNLDPEIQKKMYRAVLDNPFNSGNPYCMCISSMGNDSLAQYAAALILSSAKLQYDERRTSWTSFDPPKWHILTGSYYDRYRDVDRPDTKGRDKRKPSLLVLSNLTADSSQIKLEKLRDLLEEYADIPRIVTFTGKDPISFFTHTLRYKLQGALYLNSSNRLGKTIQHDMEKIWQL